MNKNRLIIAYFFTFVVSLQAFANSNLQNPSKDYAHHFKGWSCDLGVGATGIIDSGVTVGPSERLTLEYARPLGRSKLIGFQAYGQCNQLSLFYWNLGVGANLGFAITPTVLLSLNLGPTLGALFGVFLFPGLKVGSNVAYTFKDQWFLRVSMDYIDYFGLEAISTIASVGYRF